MATAVIIVLLVIVCVFSVKSYMKKLSHGCCGAGGDNEGAAADRDNWDISGYNFRYAVKIGGMSCKNCAAKIENTFNRKEGVYSRADFKKGTAEIFSLSPLSEFAVRQTVVGLGYSVEEIKELTV
ncbi:MAG: ATPase P [Ruminococcus sp.]|nr:ATPase P [Ruminococcus sp.]